MAPTGHVTSEIPSLAGAGHGGIGWSEAGNKLFRVNFWPAMLTFGAHGEYLEDAVDLYVPELNGNAFEPFPSRFTHFEDCLDTAS